jgi:hypothetical protein
MTGRYDPVPAMYGSKMAGTGVADNIDTNQGTGECRHRVVIGRRDTGSHIRAAATIGTGADGVDNSSTKSRFN